MLLWSIKVSNVQELSNCLCCNSKNLTPYLSLGSQPLANSYHHGEAQMKYPLGVQVCGCCYHSQLTHSVDPHLMFDNYIYVSGTSETLHRYFRGLTQTVLMGWKGKKPPRILEIACNDGTLMAMFQARGCPVVGVDPAQNLVALCEERGLEVYGGYWDQKMAGDLASWEHLEVDIIIAVNVLPHVPNPLEFLQACKVVLDPKAAKLGGGIYIQTSQSDMFRNGEFDAIYHEHHSYFTASSFGTLAYAAGLDIAEASTVPIHSKSFLFKLAPMRGSGHCDGLYTLLEDENAGGWHTIEKYREWARNVAFTKQEFKNVLESFNEKGWITVGYGASAKCNTAFNYFGCNLDYIVDDNPGKWGLKTPGTNISIVSPEHLVNAGPGLAIVMTAWNFKEEIIEKIKDLRPQVQDYVISYIPEVKLECLYD